MKRMVAIAAAILSCLVPVAAEAAPPTPIVTPAPAATAPPGDPSHAYPFFSSAVDLASYGYVEEEFFFEGMARTYAIPDPLGDAVALPAEPQFYRTRMVVRRPQSAPAFNGTVILEWQNDTAGFNFDALWLQSADHFMRRGYAWVGVSAQRIGVHGPAGLKAWSPARYDTLDIASDALSWDIFSQAAQWIGAPEDVDPLAGLPVERILATGASQSADKLATYHNAFHPLAGVVDGFVLFVGGGPLRTDLDVKVHKVLSETDVAGNAAKKSQAWMRVPDSERFRRWEVAGASHLDFHAISRLNVLAARDGLPVTTGAACANPPFSRIPFHFAADSAFDHMVGWVDQGVPPPSGEDIAVASLGEQVSVLARDTFGNALGGIRLAQHEVPVATNTGLNFPDTTTFCRTFGSHVAFDPATLAALYPTHGAYVSRVARVTADNVKKGFVVPEDAAATMLEAAHSAVGR